MNSIMTNIGQIINQRSLKPPVLEEEFKFFENFVHFDLNSQGKTAQMCGFAQNISCSGWELAQN